MSDSEVLVASSPSYACATCGGRGTWHPGRQEVVCPSCGTAVAGPPKASGPVTGFALLPRLRDRPDSGRDWQAGATRVRCASCHTVMEYAAGVAGRNCDACGSPTLVPCEETGAPVAPSGVLPFRITEAEARTRLATWMASQPLRVRRLRPSVEAVRATYLPCWVFSARVRCPWRGEITRVDREGESRTVAISGEVDRTFDEVLVPASPSFPSDLLRSVEPFPMSDLAVFDTRYLAGYAVEIYAVNMWDAWDIASRRIQAEVDTALRADSHCSPEALETWPEWTGQQCTHALVPAYGMTYRHRATTYEAVVNGWTGNVAAHTPRNVIAEVITVLILLAIVAALGYGVVWIVRGIM